MLCMIVDCIKTDINAFTFVNCRHVIYAPSAQDSYSGINFPGLTDLLFQIEGAADAADRWEKVRQHLAVLQFVVDSAASTLKPVSEFN